jgi:hypothetical protein
MTQELEKYGMTTSADGPDAAFFPDEQFTGMYRVGEDVAKATGVKGMSIISGEDTSLDISSPLDKEDFLAALNKVGVSDIESINEEAMWGPKNWEPQ